MIGFFSGHSGYSIPPPGTVTIGPPVDRFTFCTGDRPVAQGDSLRAALESESVKKSRPSGVSSMVATPGQAFVQSSQLRILAFFGGRGDPLKKRILPITFPSPSFSYCLRLITDHGPKRGLHASLLHLLTQSRDSNDYG